MTRRAIVISGVLLVLIGLTTWLVWPCAKPISPAPTPTKATARAVPVHAHEHKAGKEPMPNVASNPAPDSAGVIRGDIRRSTGEAISGAFVWAELAEDSENLRRWQFLVERGRCTSVGDQVGTDADGAFTVPALSLARPVVVRYYVPGETYGGAGPFDVQHPPPAWLSMVVNNGGRLYGVFKSCDGVPVTNVRVQLGCHSLVSNTSASVPQRTMNIDIADDGSYTSHVLPAGFYSAMLDAPGYQRAETRELLNVRAGELTPCDIVFEPDKVSSYGGVVIDWHTKLPLPDVSVTYGTAGDNRRLTTDGNGHFLFNDTYGCAAFSHAGYTDFSCTLREGTNATVYLSAGADVDVFVWTHDGKPFTNISVQLSGPLGDLWRFGQTLQNMLAASTTGNHVMLKDVPVHFAPMCARISQRHFIALSDAFTPVAGKCTRVDVQLPPPAALIMQFSATVDPAEVRVYVYLSDPSGEDVFIRSEYDFAKTNTTWLCSDLPCGSYRLHVVLPGLSLMTNIMVTAPSTELCIMVPNQGVIVGRVHDRAGTPVSSSASAYTGDFAAVDMWQHMVYVRGTMSAASGDFVLNGLDPAARYLVQVQINSFTNMIMQDVAPNGPPLDICLPRSAQVTGMVKDADGKPLKAQVGVDDKQRALQHGEFLVSPVYPGPHILYVAADGYAPLRLSITVGETDLDVGDERRRGGELAHLLPRGNSGRGARAGALHRRSVFAGRWRLCPRACAAGN
ncbi:MAG: hypothetical protein NTV22_06620 [bacterium]|nr:hypothetical protein [bacterium]